MKLSDERLQELFRQQQESRDFGDKDDELIDPLLDTIKALLAAQGAQDETGWLIERNDAQWFTGRTWTKDSTKAVKFFSREDAEWTMKLIEFDPAANVKVTEHIWVMKVQTDFHAVNLSTGTKTRSIVGEGQVIDEVVGPIPAAPPLQGAGTPPLDARVLPAIKRAAAMLPMLADRDPIGRKTIDDFADELNELRLELESAVHQSPVEALREALERICKASGGINTKDDEGNAFNAAELEAKLLSWAKAGWYEYERLRRRALAAQEKPPAQPSDRKLILEEIADWLEGQGQPGYAAEVRNR
jgi:hypothetical protein